MATRTGTPSQVDASAGDGSTSVTVPSDCDLVVAFWDHWDGDAGSILSGLELNGVAFTLESQLAEGATVGEPGVGVARLVSPATGSQTLAWTWSAGAARTEGGKIVLVYVTGANLSDPVRAAGTDANLAAGGVSVTLSTVATDLLLAFCQSFTPTNPAIDGTVFINNAALNSHIYDASEVAPGASSTTVNMTGEDYSSMAAISLKAAVASTAPGVPATKRPPGTKGPYDRKGFIKRMPVFYPEAPEEPPPDPSVAPRPTTLQVKPAKRKRAQLVVQQLAARASILPATRGRAPITLVQPKKRRKRAGSGKLLRTKLATAAAPAIRPKKPATIVTAKKRRGRATETIVVTGARRSPKRPPKPLTQVTSRKTRKRGTESTLITGARRAAVAPAVRPSKPIQIVEVRKRRQKPKPVQLLKPSRGAPASPAKRPTKPLTQVRPTKRRRRPGESSLISGARRAPVQAPARKATLTVAAPKKRRKRTPDVTIVTGARRAPRRKRPSLTVVSPKRKRRPRRATTRITPRIRGTATPITRAIRKSTGTIALEASRAASVPLITAIDQKTVALLPAASSSIALRPSHSATISLQPLNTSTTMSTLNSSIKSVVAGDDLDVIRTVTAVPAGQTLTKAWLTFKTNPLAADPGLKQKEITGSAVAGVGHITDTGASGTGTLLFQLTGTDTLGLPIGKNVPYDIKVLTSAGKIYTAEQGNYFAVRRLTTATS